MFLGGKLAEVQTDGLVMETTGGERRMDVSEVKKISLSGVKDSPLEQPSTAVSATKRILEPVPRLQLV